MIGNTQNGASLSQRAYEAIRRKILACECPLGTPLSRRRIAEELGMSLIPVSEAFQRLENEGLLESKARAGTRVRVPTPVDVRGHYVVREALESQSARLFAELATREQRQQLRDMAQQVDMLSKAVASAPAVKKAALSFEFEQTHWRLHAHIAESTNCPALVAAIERSGILIFSWLYHVAAEMVSLPPRWHADLARALSSRDPQVADAAMRRHVAYRQEGILEHFARVQEDGQWQERFARGPQRRIAR